MSGVCEKCGQALLDPAAWEWAVSSGGAKSSWRGASALDAAYDAAERRLESFPNEHVAILLSTSLGVSWGVADTCEGLGENWVVGRERWRANHAKAVRAGRAAP